MSDEAKRQGRDGMPHLTYFDKRTQASFVWDGQSDVIEVSIGGYGEPVDHTIPRTWKAYQHIFSVGVRSFGEACAAHAATLPDYS